MYQCNDGPDLLNPGGIATWNFRENLLEDNEYRCWFAWLEKDMLGLKKASFIVYDLFVQDMCGANMFKMNRSGTDTNLSSGKGGLREQDGFGEEDEMRWVADRKTH
ncbi:hypothetical protein Tco_0790539 [Tanacetum coccineum]